MAEVAELSLLWIQAAGHPVCSGCGDRLDRDPWDEEDRDPDQNCSSCGEQGHHGECCQHAGRFSQQLEKDYPDIESLHRGLSMDLPQHVRAQMAGASSEHAAHALLSHIDEYGKHSGRGLGQHWTTEEGFAKGYTSGGASGRSHSDSTSAVLHIRPPDYQHVINDRDEAENLAYQIDPYSDDWPEVPLREGAPAHLTGLSWKHGNGPWEHHEFHTPVERRI